MIRTLLATVALGALSVMASAADLPGRSPAPSPVYALPAFSWSGLYAGADLGYVWGGTRALVPFAGVIASPKANNVSLGGHLGYRHQYSNNFVVGLEGDASWIAGNRARASFPVGGADALNRLRWDAGLRASLGYSFGRLLPYATGGVAFTAEDGCTSAPGGACVANSGYSNTRTGWTIGAGLAYALTDNWIANAEYRYADFGSKTYVTPGIGGGITVSRIRSNTVLVGLSYKFGGPSAVVAKY